MAEPPRAEEPVWLVRIVLFLVVVGFTAYMARQLWALTH